MAEYSLKVQNISVTFPDDNGGLHTLEDISFKVEEQQFICILGPSGCGKTTLLRILAGFLYPTHGRVEYHGDPRLSTSHDIGFVFQNANLMPWRTVLENITLPLEMQGVPKSEAVTQATKYIEMVGLNGFEEYLPRDLSGGMAQRVAIARVLVYDPDVLLLDEPFGALDALTRQHMCTELQHIWYTHRKTMVMVTHSISDAVYLADTVLVMSPRPGRISLTLPIDLPRPRLEQIRYTTNFISFARRLREAIG